METAMKIVTALGGRKMTLILIALVLVTLRDVVGMDEETVNAILKLAIGGAGAVAFEDAAKGFLKRTDS